MSLTAKEHYADRYHLQLTPSPHNYWLYGYIAGLGDIKSVFEFGCNAGRHLNQLRRQGLEVDGMDISPRAVLAAKLHHDLDVRVGDEEALDRIPTDAYDAVLTVSVLSHMEEAGLTISQLERIARKHVFFVETRTRGDANNYWWIHDYPGKSVYSYLGGQVNAVYQVWHLRK